MTDGQESRTVDEATSIRMSGYSRLHLQRGVDAKGCGAIPIMYQ